MGYRSQVALVLTEEAEATLRTRVAALEPTTLRTDLMALLDRDALRLASTRHHQTLYFWDWRNWRRTDGVVSWLTDILDSLSCEAYLLRVLGEDDGDNRIDGELEDTFRVSVRRFIDLDPDPDVLFQSRTAYERLLDSARVLSTARERAASDRHIEWQRIDEAHALSGPALRFLVGR